ncbi:hypothetical protein H4R19_003298 [Coemansia spiralis]|nr:hypothetical protein H4R19_003298 [Coemansia spiralis]
MKPPLWLDNIRSKPVTIWIAASMAALINRLIYTLTIACLPDLLQRTMGASPTSNGVVTAAFGVGGLIGGMLTGYLSDRAQNRIGFQIGASVLYVVAGLILFFAEHLYLVVLFRIVLGVASSTADTMLFTTVADVYPANLLGFKMAVIFAFDNVGNMLGPLLGGKAYESTGISGVSVIAISLGSCSLAMNLVFVRNSLAIRNALAAARLPSESKIDDDGPLGADEVCCSSRGLSVSTTRSKLHCADAVSAAPSDDDAKGHSKVEFAHLLLRLPVAGPTVAVFVATGLQTVVETVLPLRLYDKFHYSPETISIAFLVVGAVLILAMPAIGYANDVLVARYGELKRYYAIAAAALAVFLAQIVVALATSYPVLIFGYVLFAVTAMAVAVPAQSAFGDYINSTGSHAMAQCYSLAWLAEGLSNISLPLTASALYATVSFPTMLLSISAVLCVMCAAVVLAFPARQRWRLRACCHQEPC